MHLDFIGSPMLLQGHPLQGPQKRGIRISVWDYMESRRSCSCLSTPLRPGKQVGRTPEGRRARCAPFPEGTGMCLPEMPRLLAHRSRAAGPTGRPGGLLWLLSWPHKKVTRAKRGTPLALASARDRKANPTLDSGYPNFSLYPLQSALIRVQDVLRRSGPVVLVTIETMTQMRSYRRFQ